ncbi:hypothetical protein FHS51_000779 [Sphingobium wenxiniae]|uniref:Helix-turn-helix protein n=1 Tax=Sphingobium wenxiniae (strain DSM 21828 / CGMCC 1.7748 / JZ-1) TaxID=595605 RepID=A0A562KIS0_SPHWJ|nr:hypothetical protein [Sphingobium wenxiniae]MBB6190566.1 hypothetical protein [Sphingobium wenxiniae]TWH95280.1 hypothetical protein IQ35_01536 [Sphingobium wenxiniae]
MAKRKARADCRADTRGGAWAGIPVCVVNSPAYRDLSLWARAILVELVARMNGYNNGHIALSVAEICTALSNSSRSRAAKAIAELMEHGFIDVTHEAMWKERKAREYRLTFVTTAYPPFGATNDYRNWEPRKQNSGNGVLPETPSTGNGVLPDAVSTGNGALPRLLAHQRKSAKNGKSPNPVSGNTPFPLIYNHTPPRKTGDGNKSDSTGNMDGPSQAVPPSKGGDGQSAAVIREKLKSLLRSSPTGTQTRLAEAARIPGGTLSKFINEGKALSAAHSVRLQLTMAELEKSAGASRAA